jgi:hypothetical protein
MQLWISVISLYFFLLRLGFVQLTKVGPSILHTNSDDEDIIVGSGQGWGSGSGHLEWGLADDEDQDFPSAPTKSAVLKLVTPDLSRISCVVCSTVGDSSCRDPYRRNESHIQACQTSVEGCLKVVTPSGDTYRNCLYGIFATAEQGSGCRVIKEDLHVGHKFVINATICICRTNECNGYYEIGQPKLASSNTPNLTSERVNTTNDRPLLKSSQKDPYSPAAGNGQRNNFYPFVLHFFILAGAFATRFVL